MKSAILVKSRKPLIVDNIELPKQLRFGQVQVKIIYSGICGSQINEIDAKKGVDKYLPHLLGHEGSGVVEKIGEGVTRVKKGDHVVLHWRKSSGVEAEAAKYIWNGKKVNAGKVTTFSEKSIVSENRLTDQTVALLIKEYLNLAGIDSKNYSGHSLRSGFATSAAESGVEERSIMAMTGHKSTEMVRRYIKEANLFKNNALNKIKI